MLIFIKKAEEISMKRVFIIGNASSIWMREYIREIHVKNGDRVWVTSFDSIDQNDFQMYNNMGVTVVELSKRGGIVGKLEKTYNLFRFAKRHLKGEEAFDWLEIQSPPISFQRKILFLMILFLNCKVFTAFWGSDILAINEEQAKRLIPILDKSIKINLPTTEMRNKFKYFYGSVYSNKISECNYGTLAFPHISRAKKELGRIECKEAFNLNKHKCSIAVGYNGKASQQHIKVINSLSNLCEYSKQQIELIVHMGYGTDKNREYYNKVKHSLMKSGIDYVIVDQMLPLESIGKLRVATDIFVHAQTTDALSGTIRECIFSEAILINPIWIQEYEKLGVDYIEYEQFDLLPEIIDDYLDGKYHIDTKRNAKLVSSVYSWDAVREDWLKVING